MTGFGRATFSAKGQEVTVEVRTLNHRHLDIKTKVPASLSFLETKMRGIIKERLSRGSVVLTILAGDEDGAGGQSLNMEAAQSYLKAANKLKAELDIPGEVDLGLILRQKGILSEKGAVIDEKIFLQEVRKGLGRVLDDVVAWRVKEGKALAGDLKKRLRAIKSSLSKIEKAMPKVRLAHKKRLAARISGLSSDALNEPSVLVEAAIFAEKTDITEEIVRLKSHITAFGAFLAADDTEPIGKKLDFLAQEIFRELNTIASKAQDAAISQTIVSMKYELEKIREQALNIE